MTSSASRPRRPRRLSRLSRARGGRGSAARAASSPSAARLRAARLPDRHRCRERSPSKAAQSVGSRHHAAACTRACATAGSSSASTGSTIPKGSSALQRLRAAARAVPGNARPHHLHADRAADAQRGARIPRDPPQRSRTAAGHINGRFAEFDWTPLRYLNKSFNQRALCGFLRAAQHRPGDADARRHEPRRQGICRGAGSGRSRRAGAVLLRRRRARARAALLVNPFDIDGMAEAMHEALAMPLGSGVERWQSMMELLQPQRHHRLAREFRRGAGARPTPHLMSRCTASSATSARPTRASRSLRPAAASSAFAS